MLIVVTFTLLDGQDINIRRHYRLHEGTPRENQEIARRNPRR